MSNGKTVLACGACSAEATGSDRFCGNCGMKMLCRTCGHDRHVAACKHKLGRFRRIFFRREYCCCTQVDLPRGVVGIGVPAEG